MQSDNCTQRFVVAGYAPFPADMLRIDQCWPATSEQAYKIAACHLLCHCEIMLQRHIKSRTAHPSYQQWLDYGWKVTHEFIVEDTE